MKAIDRIMRAYSRTHTLTDDEHLQVRGELSKFVQDLLVGKQPVDENPKRMQQERQGRLPGKAT
jgi:hypothetical protein